MNRLLAAIAIVVVFVGMAIASRIPVDVDGTIKSPEQIAFHRGDAVSVPYALTKDSGKYSIALASNVVWDIAAYTNPAIVWQSVMGSIDNATNGWLTVSLTSSNSIIPEGRYWGYVKALYTNGQQRVVVKQLVTVKYAPDDVDPAVSEIGYYARMSDLQSALFPYATKSWVEANAKTGSVDMVARDAAALATNLSSQANARAIEAQAAVSNLPPIPTNAVSSNIAIIIAQSVVSNWSLSPTKTTIDAGTNHLFRNSGGQNYFVDSTNSGDLLFSATTGLELDMNDGDIDGLSDLQVATISPRLGGDAPNFVSGLILGGVTRTTWPTNQTDASGWSQYQATQDVDFEHHIITNAASIYFSGGDSSDIVALGGNNLSLSCFDTIFMRTLTQFDLGADFLGPITFGGVTRTNWPESGSGDASSWSRYAATQSVDFAWQSLDNIGQMMVQNDIVAEGNIILEGGDVYGVGTFSATNITLGGVTRTTWPNGGWSIIATNGTGNVVTGLTASGTTLTEHRGTVAGGGGGTAGAESEPLKYAWATNIVLVAGTNISNQRILSIDGPTTVVPPTKASISNDFLLKLTVPSRGTNTFLFATNTPPVVGYVPSASTNSYRVILIGSDAGSSNVWMSVLR